MTEEKRIGKIESVRFGFGGYQDVEFGLFLTISGKGWGVSASISGGWSLHIKHSEHCKWTEDGRSKQYDEMCRKLQQIMLEANVESIDRLKGIPIEAVFDGMMLKDWRVLSEAL